MHFMSHRGSSRLARVIPSMHGHLCVVWWLFSSPVSFPSPFRCSSSRPSRCLPPSSTRSSCPKTCATSAWGPWPVMTTRHPSHFHQGFHGGILHHRRHGDSPNNLPHLMSQQLALEHKRKNTSSSRPVAKRLRQCIFLRNKVFHHSSNSRARCLSFLAFRCTCDALRTPQHFNGSRLRVKSHSIKSSGAELPCLCAADYTFHYYDLTFFAPCWCIVGEFG